MLVSDKFSDEDIWKGIILFGLNAATYKMALAKSLLDYSQQEKLSITWHELAESFLNQYIQRLGDGSMPQQGNPTRLTVMERVVKELQVGTITHTKAIERVADKGLENVVPRFQTIGRNVIAVKDHFYTIDYGKSIVLKDSLLGFSEQQANELEQEFTARWSLLEGAFSMNQQHFELANNVRDIYLKIWLFSNAFNYKYSFPIRGRVEEPPKVFVLSQSTFQ